MVQRLAEQSESCGVVVPHLGGQHDRLVLLRQMLRRDGEHGVQQERRAFAAVLPYAERIACAVGRQWEDAEFLIVWTK